MGKGSDIAIDAATMTILSSDLNKIPQAIRLSTITIDIIHQNLFWALSTTSWHPFGGRSLFPITDSYLTR